MNQWHLVCLVLNSATDTAYIYIDGSVKGRTKMGGGTLNSLGTIANTALGNGYEVPTNYFQGKIDEVLMYNRALTPQEVSLLYIGTTAIFWLGIPSLATRRIQVGMGTMEQ